MKPPPDENILEMLLVGTPSAVVTALAGNDPQALEEIDALRELLASLALSLRPVAPSLNLREKVLTEVSTQARFTRRAALVVIDMLNDHLRPGAPLGVPRALDIVAAVRARIDQARLLNEPVIYLCDHHEPDDPDFESWPLHNVNNPRDDIWPALAPMDSDPIVTHRAYSGFFETELHSVLKGLDVNTLVLTGCITEMHLYLTAGDALQRGYNVEVPAACQAGSSPEAEHMILGLLSMMPRSTPLHP